MEGAVKNLSKFDIRISYVFIRLILPVFFFEVASSTQNVEQEWKKLNMHGNNGKIKKLKWRLKSRKIPIYLQNSFPKKVWGSAFSQTEKLCAWNLSKCSKSRLPRGWGSEPLPNF